MDRFRSGDRLILGVLFSCAFSHCFASFESQAVVSSHSYALPSIYGKVVQSLNRSFRPAARLDVLDLSNSTPFCRNFTVPEAELDEIEPECNRWEEHELDMFLMYVDLIAVGMDESLAQKFYEEIRCLSRRHVQRVEMLHAWEVCFKHDYSEIVGTLLSRYVKEDTDLTKSATRLKSTSRSATDAYSSHRSSFLLSYFRDSTSFRIYNGGTYRFETSCCKSCSYSKYFINLESGQCQRDPFGKHCCHVACKSLGRLKVGASSSTSFCCQRAAPLPCQR